MKRSMFLFLISLFFIFSCDHSGESGGNLKKDVEVESLSIHGLPVDVKKVEWTRDIPSEKDSVLKRNVDIVFKGEIKAVQTLLATLQVKEITSIAEEETKDLELSTTETDVFKAWKKIVKVRREKQNFQDKDVEVESLSICEADVDIEEAVWNCLIPNEKTTVDKNAVDIKFKGENTQELKKTLSVQAIPTIAEGEVKDLVLSTTRTSTYKAWTKTIKVRRSYAQLGAKNEIRFKKLLLLTSDYKDDVNAQLDSSSFIAEASIEVELASLQGDKKFKKADLEYELTSNKTGDFIIPSAEIRFEYEENSSFREVKDDEEFDLATLVKAGQDAKFKLIISPKSSVAWQRLDLKIRFCVRNNQAELLEVSIPKSSFLFNKDAGLSDTIILNAKNAKLEITKDASHDGTVGKPILAVGKVDAGVAIEKITDLFIVVSDKAVVKYGADKDSLDDPYLVMGRIKLVYANAPLLIEIKSEDGSAVAYYTFNLSH